VALRADRGGEASSDVVWDTAAERRSAVPSSLVTTETIRVGRSETVVVIQMAVRAGVHFACGGQLVRAEERPASRGVVEDDIRPEGRVMTRGAIGGGEGSARCGVHGIVGLLPGREVALRVTALRRANLQIVVIVDVAVGAGVDLAGGSQLVGIREREAGGGVIKIRGVPGNCCVTGGACGNRKYRGCRGMLRVGCLLPRG